MPVEIRVHLEVTTARRSVKATALKVWVGDQTLKTRNRFEPVDEAARLEQRADALQRVVHDTPVAERGLAGLGEAIGRIHRRGRLAAGLLQSQSLLLRQEIIKDEMGKRLGVAVLLHQLFGGAGSDGSEKRRGQAEKG